VLGQTLLDLGLLRHVADGHPFADANLFYDLLEPLPAIVDWADANFH